MSKITFSLPIFYCWKKVLWFVLFLLVVGVIGRMDMEDQAAQVSEYCQKVSTGQWPDYKNVGECK